MASEFVKFPEQYKTNLEFLKSQPDEQQYLIEYEVLEKLYEKLANSTKVS